MNFLDPAIENFAKKFTTEESTLLKKINRDTHAKILRPRMLSGHLQGQALAMFSSMIKPKSILEIGTYTGYSAICLVEGLQENGVLHTIESNEELESVFTKYFKEANLQDMIKSYIGTALDIIPTIKGQFDLIFIDADKSNYSNYFNITIDKLNVGGYIIADNVLWSGKVISPKDELDSETLAIVNFCELVANDSRMEQVLFPIRDGLLVCRKISD
ncbi:MAG: O-methyltransferase [Flavobacteriales bacterium]|nr:O-methyltransferase [Flavobacteriales bacterium]